MCNWPSEKLKCKIYHKIWCFSSSCLLFITIIIACTEDAPNCRCYFVYRPLPAWPFIFALALILRQDRCLSPSSSSIKLYSYISSLWIMKVSWKSLPPLIKIFIFTLFPKFCLEKHQACLCSIVDLLKRVFVMSSFNEQNIFPSNYVFLV